VIRICVGQMTEAFKDAKEKSLFCAQAALEKKASHITILELKQLSAVTDYFLICSGRSDRQVQAIAQFIEEQMREKGVRPLGEEGMQQGRWILMSSSISFMIRCASTMISKASGERPHR
jgi:ribosome silencing factor RsfS/YbeB/iojap